MTKNQLRLELRQRRKRFVVARRSNILNLDLISDSAIKLLISHNNSASFYVATAFECNIVDALLTIHAKGARLALPCAETLADTLQFRQWNPGEPLVRSPLGFDQPHATAPILTPDLIFTPLLGFDRQMNRLGQGAGFYDRAFAAFPAATRIGVAWSCQEVDKVPTDSWDMPLDVVLTENGALFPTNPRTDKIPI